MSTEMFTQIIELVEKGGVGAIWIYVIHCVVGVLKFVIGFGCLYLSATKICQTIKAGMEKANG